MSFWSFAILLIIALLVYAIVRNLFSASRSKKRADRRRHGTTKIIDDESDDVGREVAVQSLMDLPLEVPDPEFHGGGGEFGGGGASGSWNDSSSHDCPSDGGGFDGGGDCGGGD